MEELLYEFRRGTINFFRRANLVNQNSLKASTVTIKLDIANLFWEVHALL